MIHIVLGGSDVVNCNGGRWKKQQIWASWEQGLLCISKCSAGEVSGTFILQVVIVQDPGGYCWSRREEFG